MVKASKQKGVRTVHHDVDNDTTATDVPVNPRKVVNNRHQQQPPMEMHQLLLSRWSKPP